MVWGGARTRIWRDKSIKSLGGLEADCWSVCLSGHVPSCSMQSDVSFH